MAAKVNGNGECGTKSRDAQHKPPDHRKRSLKSIRASAWRRIAPAPDERLPVPLDAGDLVGRMAVAVLPVAADAVQISLEALLGLGPARQVEGPVDTLKLRHRLTLEILEPDLGELRGRQVARV